MKKKDVIEFYGSTRKVAKALNIYDSAVSMWGEVVPLGRAYQIQAMTKNKLKVNQEDYAKEK